VTEANAPWTISRVIAWTAKDLHARGIESSRLDAELLVAHALKLRRLDLYLRFDQPLDGAELAAVRALVERRRRKEPVAYILGAREFYGRSFTVDRRVLIPRPETEGVIEACLALLPPPAEGVTLRALDVCAGSGCIAITLAAERPDWLRDSCVEMGGHRRFLFELLRRGRSVDPRWGLDRRTGPLSGDIVTYFYGDGCPEGSREVYMFDVIIRHCARPGVDEPAAPGWLDRTPEGGVWTLMGYDPSILADAGAPPPDVTAARPPLPDGSGVVRAVAAERPDLLRNSCVDMGGNNEFLFEVVRRLRRMDPRWGLNWKRGRVGDMSQDVVDYYYGPAGAPMEGSPDTYVVDMIGGHCGPTPSPAWIDVTGVGGALALWTLAGRTDL
jgi:hypothetical protein